MTPTVSQRLLQLSNPEPAEQVLPLFLDLFKMFIIDAFSRLFGALLVKVEVAGNACVACGWGDTLYPVITMSCPLPL